MKDVAGLGTMTTGNPVVFPLRACGSERSQKTSVCMIVSLTVTGTAVALIFVSENISLFNGAAESVPLVTLTIIAESQVDKSDKTLFDKMLPADKLLAGAQCR